VPGCGGGGKRGAAASAGAEQSKGQGAEARLGLRPVNGETNPPSQKRDVENVAPLACFVFRQEVEQERGETELFETTGGMGIPRRVAAGSAAMREDNQPAGIIGYGQESRQAQVADPDFFCLRHRVILI
jgi:hypothetical protein